MAQRIEVVYKPLSWFKPYARNPRKNDDAVDRMVASIREFGFPCPVLARSTGDVCDGHLRLKGAAKVPLAEVPVVLCDDWTEAQFRAFRLLANRSATWADFDDELLALELQELNEAEFDLSLTGFDPRELDDLLLDQADDEKADEVPPVPAEPVTRAGDLWLLGDAEICPHCGAEN
jgi:ParB-like chromosome segregation protein Spo0J